MTLESDLNGAFGKKEISMWKRMWVRSAVLVVLTAISMGLMELLIWGGKSGWTDFNDRWPEVIVVLRAAFIMTWIEVSLLWIRTAIAPHVDMQAAARKAAELPMGAAIALVSHTAQWAFRFWVFLHLCEFLK